MQVSAAVEASFLAELVEQQVDGLSLSAATARLTLSRIARFVAEQSTVYLPTHDPRSGVWLRGRIATAATILDNNNCQV